MPGIDLDAYFHRIGWGGETSPTLATLSALLNAHMSAIPFENLDVLLRRPIRLDLDSIQDKLVKNGRGGYCMEHGVLFGAVLDQLGFKPVRHSARVLMKRQRTEAPRTHMFFTVQIGRESFVIDPGFGALAPRLPVPLIDAADGAAAHDAHWMARDGQRWILRAKTGRESVEAWISTLEEENPVDFDMANHYTSTHPASPFVNNMMLRALTPDGYVGVMNRNVNIWRGNECQSIQLADRQALRTLLNAYFGFDLAEVEHLCVPAIPEWR